MLEVRACTNDDFADFVRIQLAAFNTGITRVMKPIATVENNEKAIQKHIESATSEPDVHYLKVVDTELDDKIIACAKWRINEKERTEEQIQSMLPVPGEEEKDRPAAQDFMNYLHRVRKQFMGTKPFAFLHVLVVDPPHQRRSAGTLLVNWGLELADKSQLPSFLEASDAGKKLYTSLGFEPVHVETFDLSKYDPNLSGLESNTAMLRKAAPLHRQPSESTQHQRKSR
ncbi:acyl-CoA N-acyltransferase [Karstenula rhodostoma CBS 690.94]|uniref:Acyl-CoA N-acyltransferase n=1 Tax=Karstenula rhodostoma CBS 690.94 TaxID=1392251 RepID=A0A9P4PBN2_9PLEO|nr:acyl-CoA N-acyltransferase [Karstenula rhodostoma CBS 690.94]